MIYENEDKFNSEFRNNCSECFGLCCTALYFSTCDGFPTNKDAGKPCIHLQNDFKCSIHQNLRSKGLKGCTSYDCFGAGQKVSQITFEGRNWKDNPDSADEIFEAFLIMRQLHEILWYLTQAFFLQKDSNLKSQIDALIEDTYKLTLLRFDSLSSIDLNSHRDKVNVLLKLTSESVCNKIKQPKKSPSKKNSFNLSRSDYFAADLRKKDLKGFDFSGACLIAANLKGVDLSQANFIGADLRDTDISGADLTNSIYLTQSQINTAKGDSSTKIPKSLIRPPYWTK